MSKTLYGSDFYESRQQRTETAAREILGIVLPLLPKIKSAADVGCGVGTWLAELKKNGVTSVVGIDGPWVQKEKLQIDFDDFLTHDFSKNNIESLKIKVKPVDLVICLEVAEHIEREKAETFVKFLCSMAPAALFSAAIPHQGGTGHINEQWPDYWAKLFDSLGYQVVDLVRDCIWNREDIPYWYKQNTILYVKTELVKSLQLQTKAPDGVLRKVHPALWEKKHKERKKNSKPSSILKKAIKKVILVMRG